MIYILNPGDGHDVKTFTDRVKAERAFGLYPMLSRLYSFSGKMWREYSYSTSTWHPCNRDNLPVKVLDAGR